MVLTAAAIFLALRHDQAMVLIRFTLLILAATTGLSLFWLWKRPASEIINSHHQP